ncbi:MAG: hypothetical protein U1E45_13665 [Geminicoccaceae bacterium]
MRFRQGAVDRSWILRRLRRLAAVLVLGAIALPTIAEAREDYCINPSTGRIDTRGTNAYRIFETQSNLNIMARLNGIWLTKITSRPTNQVSYLYEKFSFVRGVPASGLYSYTNYVCTLQNTFCSRYDGVGVYAVRSNGTNKFLGTKIVSDTVRLDHACLSLTGTFLSNTVLTNGVVRTTKCSMKNGKLVC